MARSPRRVLWWAVAVALLATAASAGAVDKGITQSPYRNGAPLFGELQELGVDFNVVNVNWRSVASARPVQAADPADPAYRWGALDQLFADAQGTGIEIVPIVLGTPLWANGGQPQNVPPADVEEYAAFISAVSARYPQIERWMIWGEPSRSPSWAPQGAGGARIYARLLDSAYAAVKRADPGDLVIGGNTYCCGRNDEHSTSTRRWLEHMRLPDGRRPRLDLWGMNPYGSRPIDINADPIDPTFMDYNDLDTLVALIDEAYPGQRVQLFVSEDGTPTDRGNRDRPFFTTREEQATRLRQFFQLAEDLGRVAAISNFLLYDQPANPDEQGRPTGWTTGLRTVEGVKKPAWAVFQSLGSRSGSGPSSPGGAGGPGAAAPPGEGRVPPDGQPPPAGTGQNRSGTFSLSARQLRINQRISQAAVRRANAVQAWLDAGLTTGDLRPGSLAAADFGPGIVVGAASGSARAAEIGAGPRPVVIASAGGGAGAPVRLGRAQLLVNQRISQAAVRRSNALTERLRRGLSGGDIRDGAIVPAHLAPGLAIAAASGGAPAPPTRTIVRGGQTRSAAVALSVAQLRINQRISQAAVRRNNALIARIKAGLGGEEIRDGSIGPVDLAPAARP